MNKNQIDYLLKNYRKQSVKDMADHLKVDRKEVQRELRKILSSQQPAAGPQKEAAGPVPAEGSPRRSPFLRPEWRHHIVALALIALAVFFVYEKTLYFPFLDWDDPAYVTENASIREMNPANVKEMFSRAYMGIYVPLTVLSFAVDYQAGQFNPFAYHLTNLFLHNANTWCVYGLIFFLTGEWLVAVAVALVFAIHPVQVESVVWIAERKNVLSAFFFFLAFFAYGFGRRFEKKDSLFYGASFLLFIIACLSKPSIVVFFLVLIAFDGCYGYWDRKRPLFGRLPRYAPFVTGAVIFSLITILITRGEGKSLYHGGNLFQTMLAMAVVMMKYLNLIFLPLRQSALYQFPVYGSIFNPPVLFSFLGLGLIAGALFYVYRLERKYFFWGAWYFILLLPVMNIIPFPSLMNDRYLYLPLVGITTLVFLALKHFLGARGVIALLFLALAGFVPLNLRRQAVWADSKSLWLETQTQTREKHSTPYINLGMKYLQEEKFDEAVEQFNKALQVSERAAAYSGLGIASMRRGDYEKAEMYLKKAIEIGEDPSRYKELSGYHANLGLVYMDWKKFDLARRKFNDAIQIDPKDPGHYSNLGTLFKETGRREEALREYMRGLTADPGSASILYNLGLFYFEDGNRPEAEKYWGRLIQSHPDDNRIPVVREKLKGN